ncbi:TonB-dependent receptor plug domain-containing protein [Geomonas sp. Red32]|uniref:TonB-dependent receptor plug domain-containing protein n=1 Tax=Geomonas sp. Red32 TaxID=2912856 RepID=UPI00202CE8D8|nr:TonB-dependent receptor plug domain-containing protein [Geomonas sp. Red32]MCM0083378.1 TonB-dependent receptor plug domain-containing protein [Geomonas sp. Red32]
MRKVNIPMVSAAAVLLLAGNVQAESQLLDEIVVQENREAVNEEKVTVRELRESPARDVGEALKQAEGMSYVRKGAIANDVVLRGFQKDNINVLVDGVRLHGACPSRMDPPSFHLDLAEAEEVRIVKGPYDLSNPGGLAGTVEIETKKPGKGWHGEGNFGYGSWNNVNTSATASHGGERYDLLAGYAFKYSDVPESGDGKRLTEIYPATSMNRYRSSEIDSKAYEINTGWARFGVNLTAHSRS